jgi:hypothetical protein
LHELVATAGEIDVNLVAKLDTPSAGIGDGNVHVGQADSGASRG